MPKYIAQITVGAHQIGEVVTGLNKERADELLKAGAIKVDDKSADNEPEVLAEPTKTPKPEEVDSAKDPKAEDKEAK